MIDELVYVSRYSGEEIDRFLDNIAMVSTVIYEGAGLHSTANVTINEKVKLSDAIKKYGLIILTGYKENVAITDKGENNVMILFAPRAIMDWKKAHYACNIECESAWDETTKQPTAYTPWNFGFRLSYTTSGDFEWDTDIGWTWTGPIIEGGPVATENFQFAVRKIYGIGVISEASAPAE